MPGRVLWWLALSAPHGVQSRWWHRTTLHMRLAPALIASSTCAPLLAAAVLLLAGRSRLSQASCAGPAATSRGSSTMASSSAKDSASSSAYVVTFCTVPDAKTGV